MPQPAKPTKVKGLEHARQKLCAYTAKTAHGTAPHEEI